jgi:hypothetical protein
MSTAPPVRSSRSTAVTVVGCLTILWGAEYLVAGCSLIYAATKVAWAWVGQLLVIIIGTASLLMGLFAILAGIGTLYRTIWGRVLAMVTAVIAVLMGILFIWGGKQDVAGIALGSVQIVYGIGTIMVLSRNRSVPARGLDESVALW